jgi:hypothetical protein
VTASAHNRRRIKKVLRVVAQWWKRPFEIAA